MARYFLPLPPPAKAQDRETMRWSFTQFRDIASGLSQLWDTLRTFASFSLENFQVAVYGAIRMPSAQGGPDLNISYQPIEFMTQSNVTPRGVSFKNDSEFSFDVAGVYRLEFSGNMQHTDSNQGRVTWLRLWNVTQGEAAVEEYQVSVGRNTDGTSIIYSLMFEIDPVSAPVILGVGDWFQFQIGGGDIVSNVIWFQQAVSIFQVSEWRGKDPLERNTL